MGRCAGQVALHLASRDIRDWCIARQGNAPVSLNLALNGTAAGGWMKRCRDELDGSRLGAVLRTLRHDRAATKRGSVAAQSCTNMLI